MKLEYTIDEIIEAMKNDEQWEVPEEERFLVDFIDTLKIVSNLFFHDRELTNIHMNAYTSILNGENLADARFRYNRDIEAYHLRHNWD